MAQPYIGEIRMFAGNFAPVGWHFCNGDLLPINENDSLFNLIGTTYGGDGQSTFGVPDLRGRVPIHQSSTFIVGQNGGAETVTLNTNQLPTHTHTNQGSGEVGTLTTPQNNVVARLTVGDVYSSEPPFTGMAAQAINTVGGSQPHNNFQPYLCINFIICLFGIYPTQN